MGTAGSIAPEVFRRACGQFATGVAIATVSGPDQAPYGLTINSFTSVSCSPPLVLICLDYRCSPLPFFRASSVFGLNFLRIEQKALANRFAEYTGDRFEGVSWHAGSSGVPLLVGCLATLECSVYQTVEAGDHAVLFGEVLSAEVTGGDPLLYFGSGYRQMQPG